MEFLVGKILKYFGAEARDGHQMGYGGYVPPKDQIWGTKCIYAKNDLFQVS